MKENSFIEHRSYPRLPIHLTLNYKYLEHGDMYHTLESKTLNLSARGLAMYTDRQLPEDQHILLTLLIPHESTSGQYGKTSESGTEEMLSVMLLSRVVWCTYCAKNEYHVGMEIIQVEPEHRKRLKQFLTMHRLDAAQTAH
jgi:c-di-GMP-binding flagellar brake protein YcgR